MRYFLFVTLFFSVACGSNEKKQAEEAEISNTTFITARKLVEIIDDSSFVKFQELTRNAGFTLLDSTTNSSGYHLYMLSDNTTPANTLGATVMDGSKVIYIHITTHDKAFFERIKNELLEMGASKTTYEEGDEFRVADILIPASLVTGGDGRSYYEIVMLREK